MKLALLSDIHANLLALEACLAHAQTQGADRLAFLGDYVGYGAQPVEVLRRVMQCVDDGAIAIKGNHDEMAVSPPADVQTVGETTAQWTHDQLDDELRSFLFRLPMSATVESAILVHASADAPALWRYVSDERTATLSLEAAMRNPELRHVFGGHVHFQTLFYKGAKGGLMKFQPTPGVMLPVPRHRHWLATIGSVGQPRDGDVRAMYAIFDTDRLQLTFHRVRYDQMAAAQSVRNAALPEFFAARLEAGR